MRDGPLGGNAACPRASHACAVPARSIDAAVRRGIRLRQQPALPRSCHRPRPVLACVLSTRPARHAVVDAEPAGWAQRLGATLINWHTRRPTRRRRAGRRRARALLPSLSESDRARPARVGRSRAVVRRERGRRGGCLPAPRTDQRCASPWYVPALPPSALGGRGRRDEAAALRLVLPFANGLTDSCCCCRAQP